MKVCYRLLLTGLLFMLVVSVGMPAHSGERYWQQEVHYRMDVRLDTEDHVISGREDLTYYNHSPDTLNRLYFHLYQNAFTRGSYYDKLLQQAGSNRIRRLSEQGEGETDIRYIRDHHGNAVPYSIDNTIMRIDLDKPIVPGDSIQLAIGFDTRYGNISRRMKREGTTYIAAHWYPRIAVYDAHRGWNTDQHLMQEFYGDFGTFELSLTIPAHFIVGATGVLQNRSEMLPDSLRAKLDLGNFKDKPWGEPPSTVVEPTEETKTWHYIARNVHDVAWVASPDFRIDEAEWNGVTIYALAKEQHASGWQDAAEFTAKLIRHYSENWGMYEYPKMIVSDVNSGMEYPMLTADGGRSPRYYGLLAHEVAHNWFYGMLGSNETYRAMMDEGFTNFAASVAMRDILGPNNNTYWEQTGGWYEQLLFQEYGRKYYRNYLPFMRMARSGYLVDPLSTHSNKFNEYRSYRQVYFKMAVCLYNLEYAIGDSLFNEAMQTYVRRWKFKHPYPEDFIHVVEEVTGTDLNWFFDEWFDKTSVIDYSITGVGTHRNPEGDGYVGRVKLRRKTFMNMPVDLQVTLMNGTTKSIHIPVNDQFAKNDPGLEVADPWFGWGEINKTYTLEISTESPVRKARIDPSGRLADIHRLNNVSGTGVPVRWHFDNMVHRMPSLNSYDVWLRPSFRYNGTDGLKPGLHWESNYLPSEFLSWYDTEFGVWYGPLTQEFGYELEFETPLKSLGRLTKLHLNSQILEGREWHSFGLSGTARKELYNRSFTGWKLMIHQHQFADPAYVRDPGTAGNWEQGVQQFVQSEFHHGFRTLVGEWDLEVNLETGVFRSDYQYSKLSGEFLGTLGLSWLPETRLRIAGMVATGDPPDQRAFYNAGGSPAEAVSSSWLYRSWGTLPPDWAEKSRITYGGGLNLRGYQEQREMIDRGAGANLEISLPGRSPLESLGWNWYLFGDFGMYTLSGSSEESVHVKSDAGMGMTLPLAWIPESLGDYTVRLDFPVWVSTPVRGRDPFEVRWVFAIGRAW